MFNFLLYDYRCVGLLFVVHIRRFIPKSHRNLVNILVCVVHHAGRYDSRGLKCLLGFGIKAT